MSLNTFIDCEAAAGVPYAPAHSRYAVKTSAFAEVGTVGDSRVAARIRRKLDKAGRESEQEQKTGAYAGDDSPTWARATESGLGLFSNSLGLLMGLLFLLSCLGQSIAGTAAFNEEQRGNLEDPVC